MYMNYEIRMLLKKGFYPFVLESKRKKRAKQPLMDTFFYLFSSTPIPAFYNYYTH